MAPSIVGELESALRGIHLLHFYSSLISIPLSDVCRAHHSFPFPLVLYYHLTGVLYFYLVSRPPSFQQKYTYLPSSGQLMLQLAGFMLVQWSRISSESCCCCHDVEWKMDICHWTSPLFCMNKQHRQSEQISATCFHFLPANNNVNTHSESMVKVTCTYIFSGIHWGFWSHPFDAMDILNGIALW